MELPLRSNFITYDCKVELLDFISTGAAAFSGGCLLFMAKFHNKEFRLIGNLGVSPLKILTKGSAFGNRKGSALDPQAFEKA
ncbi:MAG: hypothetical protein II501_05105 [Clostridia bacterium]|nr:hypothetical protein [Clostridia bacterium]